MSGDDTLSARLRVWASAYFSLPIAIVTLALLAGPLRETNHLPAWFYRFSAVFLLIVPGLAFFSFRTCLRGVNPALFVFRLLYTVLPLTGLSVFLALAGHRDFFTAAFQTVMTVPAVFFLWLWAGEKPAGRKKAAKTLERLAILIAAFYVQWIFMMGYAIATRAEPRPMESVAYNLYNLGLVFILLFSSWKINLMGMKTASCGPVSLIIDGKDFSEAAGRKKTELLFLLVESPQRSLTCGEINRLQAECGLTRGEECDPDTAKATACPRYRVTYNQILELKKFLESMELGSITSPENRRNVLREGWKLTPFENVRFRSE